MRKAMIESVTDFIRKDDNSALLLVDIGVWAFRDILKDFPERVKNIGIFEDGMVSVAAGLSLQGIVPTIYGITPFIVERALEQIKLDFIYQGIGGNLITTGAAYDFSTLGYSHFCAEDIRVLKALNELEIVTPGSGSEFKKIFDKTKDNGKLTYFRLTDHPNTYEVDIEFGKANIIKRGKKATIVVFAEMLDAVIEATRDFDVNVVYYTTVNPFDVDTLRSVENTGKIVVVEPFYEGSMVDDVVFALKGKPLVIESIGVPRKVLRDYGTKKEKDELYGLTAKEIRNKLTQFCNA